MSNNKYEPNKKYIEVGDEWVSLDDLVHKKELIRLIGIFQTYIISNGNNGVIDNETILKDLRTLREKLD